MYYSNTYSLVASLYASSSFKLTQILFSLMCRHPLGCCRNMSGQFNALLLISPTTSSFTLTRCFLPCFFGSLFPPSTTTFPCGIVGTRSTIVAQIGIGHPQQWLPISTNRFKRMTPRGGRAPQDLTASAAIVMARCIATFRASTMEKPGKKRFALPCSVIASRMSETMIQQTASSYNPTLTRVLNYFYEH